MSLPDGVRRKSLAVHRDARGGLAELFRAGQDGPSGPPQWNVTWTEPNVLRGVHVHRLRTDYLCAIEGPMVVGLHDLRRRSPTFGAAVTLEAATDQPEMWVIPPGVAHGFYFAERSIELQGLDPAWDIGDEGECRWDDARLGLDWPCRDPRLSVRDDRAGDYDAILRWLEADPPARQDDAWMPS
jgi:dTDP-4-dehydrorhamnose 3,5-epimerase